MQAQSTNNMQNELPKALIAWYDFSGIKTSLLIQRDEKKVSPLEDFLMERTKQTDCQSFNQILQKKSLEKGDGQRKYDLIVIAGELEYCKEPVLLLKAAKALLAQKGRLLIGTDNRLSVRYFCGDRDAFTNRNFDGIENYVSAELRNLNGYTGRAYAKTELICMLEQAGFSSNLFYSVFPCIERPQILLADGYIPQEELDVRISPQYHEPATVFLEEQKLYKSLMQNGMLHTMADGFLIEGSVDGTHSNASQITVSMDRGRKQDSSTIIYQDEKVEKRAVYPEGIERLKELIANGTDLQNHGVKMCEAVLKNQTLSMPFIHGMCATTFLRNLLLTDKKRFEEELDCFWKIVLQSSEHVPYSEVNWEKFEPDWEKRRTDDPDRNKWRKLAFGTEEERRNIGVILKKGYIDLIPLNCIYADGEYYFFDQEFCFPNLPASVILLRVINLIYSGGKIYDSILPKKQLLERYNLLENEILFSKFEYCFVRDLKSEENLAVYNQKKRIDYGILNRNRQRMNYSEEEYQRLFCDIFKDTKGKKLYLFGTGKFAKRFLSEFQHDYQIDGIFDNNEAMWGSDIDGIPILKPSDLQNFLQGSYKVIICIKNYFPVVEQLQSMGVTSYGIYDRSLSYTRENEPVLIQSMVTETPKKYNIGYISGVFDLFHIGHLNLLRRAKEQCRYLIVGVLSDECVMTNKRTQPYIPFNERIEIIRACRYVDEAVTIQPEYDGTKEAYRRYQFDVQFSGSDYENDSIWLSRKEFLEQHGSTMVFFPYTEQTSSTKIKGLIQEKVKK